LRWVNPKAGYVFQIRMIKVENTTQPPPTQFAAIERNFHETQAGQGLRKSHTPKKVGVRFGVRAISLNCVDLRGPNTQKHMYCVEFLRVASRFDSLPKSLFLRARTSIKPYPKKGWGTIWGTGNFIKLRRPAWSNYSKTPVLR
jgi:hypothetical protein